jgi:hypothetical protein
MIHLILLVSGTLLLLDGSPIFGVLCLIIAVVGAVLDLLDRFT